MQEPIVERLKTIVLGDPQSYRDIVIFPVTSGQGDTATYIGLTEALEGGLLTVTEVSDGGSVPELKVTNGAEAAVLLLDGEELAGAKQNRVLNTTVLVPGKQAIIVPVSCTEQGRWSYASEKFYESGNVMARSIRARKNRSVSESLSESASFRSDQGEVWNGISELQEAAAMPPSPTGAMRDVFESHRVSLDEAIKAFPIMPDQIGILVVAGGVAGGLDVISRSTVYACLHAKLVKSYIMDTLVAGKQKEANPAAARIAAQKFIQLAVHCEAKSFKSVGCGEDYRFKGTQIAGSALVYKDTVIHSAFFHLDPEMQDGRMSSLNRRRSYRVN